MVTPPPICNAFMNFSDFVSNNSFTLAIDMTLNMSITVRDIS